NSRVCSAWQRALTRLTEMGWNGAGFEGNGLAEREAEGETSLTLYISSIPQFSITTYLRIIPGLLGKDTQYIQMAPRKVSVKKEKVVVTRTAAVIAKTGRKRSATTSAAASSALTKKKIKVEGIEGSGSD